MAEVIASYQVSAFVVPANLTTGDADQVRGNDNTLRASLNNHDGDAGIHFQSSPLASRPVAGVAGRKWMSSDDRRIWYDNGSSWLEVAYAPTASPTFTGTVTVGASIHSGVQLTIDTTAGVNLLVTAGGALSLGAGAAATITLTQGGVARWTVNAAGHLQAGADGTYDIGAVATFRPRAIYASTGIDAGTSFSIASVVLLRPRVAGYTNPMTGVANRATAYATNTITLQQLAERVKALTDDLHSAGGNHALIGP